MAQKRIYVAKVHGEYITQIGENSKVLKSYRATFRLPDASAPLGMIKGKLLMPFLKKLDPGAIAPYSWYLDEIRPEEGEFDPDDLPVLFQTLDQLAVYCKRHKLSVPVEEYGNLEMARQHVMLAKDDPQAFKKIFEKYQETMTSERELEDLNQNFEGIGQAGGEVDVDPLTGKTTASTRKTAPVKKAKTPVAEDEEAVLS